MFARLEFYVLLLRESSEERYEIENPENTETARPWRRRTASGGWR